MVNPALMKWIEHVRGKGHDDAKLKQTLLAHGYKAEQIDQALAEVKKPPKTEAKPRGVTPTGPKEAPKPAKPKKELSEREKNVFRPEDFEKLEAGESKKKGLLKRVFAKKKKEVKAKVVAEETVKQLSQDQMSLALKKLQDRLDEMKIAEEKEAGKLEIEEEAEKAINERISDLGEQIGELRGTIMGRERFFDKMQVEFSQMKEAISEVRPEKIQKDFGKQEQRMLKLEAVNDKAATKITNLSEQLKGYQDTMKKIGSFENIFSTLEQIHDKVKEITKSKSYVDRVSAKVETIFAELSKKRKILDEHEAKLSDLDKMSRDFYADQDKVSTKMKTFASRDDLDKLKSAVDVLKGDVFKKDVKKFGKGVKPAVKPSTKPAPKKTPAPVKAIKSTGG